MTACVRTQEVRFIATGDTRGGDNGQSAPHEVFHEKGYGYVLVEIYGLNVTSIWKHRTAAEGYESTKDLFTYTVSP
jgi:hypothetical protein